MAHSPIDERIAHRRLVKLLGLAALLTAAALVWILFVFDPERRVGRRPVSDLAVAGTTSVADEALATKAPEPEPAPARDPPISAEIGAGPVRRIVPREIPDEPEEDEEFVEDEADPPREALDDAGGGGTAETEEQVAARTPPGMLLIPGGPTWLGTSEHRVRSLTLSGAGLSALAFDEETPRHRVDVGPFYIDRTEITNLQWRVFLDATERAPSDGLRRESWSFGKMPNGQHDFPVTHIELEELSAYLEWSGSRLPTEAEWVRAARGDGEGDYPWIRGAMSPYAWSSAWLNSGDNAPRRPTSVGSYVRGASPYGVLDMAGNVLEWTASAYTPFPSPQSGDLAFAIGTTASRTSADPRVLKGGDFASDSVGCRIDTRVSSAWLGAQRHWGQGRSRLSEMRPDLLRRLGFRTARSLHPEREAVWRVVIDLASSASARRGIPLQHLTRLALGIDLHDIAHWEQLGYDEDQRVVTGFEHITFGAVGRGSGPSFAELRENGPSELAVGVLAVRTQVMASPMLLGGGHHFLVALRPRGPAQGGAVGVGEDRDQLVFYDRDGRVRGRVPVSMSEAPPGPLLSSVEEERGRVSMRVSFSVDTGHELLPRLDFTLEGFVHP